MDINRFFMVFLPRFCHSKFLVFLPTGSSWYFYLDFYLVFSRVYTPCSFEIFTHKHVIRSHFHTSLRPCLPCVASLFDPLQNLDRNSFPFTHMQMIRYKISLAKPIDNLHLQRKWSCCTVFNKSCNGIV